MALRMKVLSLPKGGEEGCAHEVLGKPPFHRNMEQCKLLFPV